MEQYPQKKYSMTHAELSAYASVLVEFVTRDLTDFADYGITTDDVTALQDMQNAFELYPIDDSFVGLSTIVRAERDAIRAQLLEKIQQIAMRFELAFGTVESPYLQLSIGDISNQSDEAFLLKSRSIISVLTEHAADVLPYGQTAPLTDAYIALAQDLEDKINAVVIANSNRSQATRTRINMGNELYDTVLRFTNIGKLIYQNTNSAKYQDYVIYGSAPAVAVHGAPSGLHFTDETTLAWTAIDNATSYGISVSSDGGSNWQADISTPTNSSSVPTVSVGKLYYKVRGHNSTGYGEYSGTFEK
ncbi:MAG: hypothetical protein JST20_03905, partial [Bacteroidetes bacterium]|nr:hypothetical protein [Bacteroidota bacterium]